MMDNQFGIPSPSQMADSIESSLARFGTVSVGPDEWKVIVAALRAYKPGPVLLGVDPRTIVSGDVTATFNDSVLLRKTRRGAEELRAKLTKSFMGGEVRLPADGVDFNSTYTFEADEGPQTYQWTGMKPMRDGDEAVFVLPKRETSQG